jgi:subtilisin family serine protease
VKATGNIVYLFIGIVCSLLHAQRKSGHEPSPYNYVPGQAIVKLKGSSLQSLHTVQVQKIAPLFPRSIDTRVQSKYDVDRLYKLRFSRDMDVPALCRQLELNPEVEFAEPNYLLPVDAVPDDSLYAQLFHLPQISAPQAWDVATGNSSVIIAIIDTGVDYRHPDLAGSIWHNPDEVEDGIDNDNNGYIDDLHGWDFVDNADDCVWGEDGTVPDNDPMDQDGHGTFVAGLAGATTNNGIGVSSISWGCTLMPLRAGYKSISGGTIMMDAAARAFKYAADNGAAVINLSTSSTLTIVECARYAFQKGVMIVKSAGNLHSSVPDPLELEPFVLSVAAVDDQDYKASYSDYGTWVRVSAPGGDLAFKRPGLLSTTLMNSYTVNQGTSFASPIVAGLAGLIQSAHPGWSAADIFFQIIGTADNIDGKNGSFRGELGSGRINALRALTENVQPAPQLTLNSCRIDDSAKGNGDGIIQPGEEISLYVTLQNNGGPAHQLTTSIQSFGWQIIPKKSTAQFPEIPGLADLDHRTVENSQDPFVLSIHARCLPARIDVPLRITDIDGNQWNFRISLSVHPSLLLVDDDDGINNVESYYYDTLDSLGLTALYWNHSSQGTPTRIIDTIHNTIWFCEQTGSIVTTLDSTDRDMIENYLSHGHNLFISGQDIGWDLCENPGSNYVNQFILTKGQSKNFYERVLHAQYLLDVSPYNRVIGQVDDPIGADLYFNIAEPGRSQQYPSEIAPLDGAITVFSYPSQRAAAIRYDGLHRLVYFAFGGLEAISVVENRITVMKRVVDYFNGFSLNHDPVSDVEIRDDRLMIKASIAGDSSSIRNMDLYWTDDFRNPFHVIPMTRDHKYFTGFIAQVNSCHVLYAFKAEAMNGGLAPIRFFQYDAIPDHSTIEIQKMAAPAAIIAGDSLFFAVRIETTAAPDSQSVFIHYQERNVKSDSLLMKWDKIDSLFSVCLPVPFLYGDSIFYYFSVKKATCPFTKIHTQPDTCVLGLEDFESGLDLWKIDSGQWALDTTSVFSGRYSISATAAGMAAHTDSAIISLRPAIDFSRCRKASLSFWTHHNMTDVRDYGLVQIQTGSLWHTVGPAVSGSSSEWYQVFVPLDEYCGQADLRIRFCLVSAGDEQQKNAGWTIDHVQLEADINVRIDRKNNGPVFQNGTMAVHPNPFNAGTAIFYSLEKRSDVKMWIVNTRGQRVRTLCDASQDSGLHRLRWDGLNENSQPVAAGIYFVCLVLNGKTSVRKIALIR